MSIDATRCADAGEGVLLLASAAGGDGDSPRGKAAAAALRRAEAVAGAAGNGGGTGGGNGDEPPPTQRTPGAAETADATDSCTRKPAGEEVLEARDRGLSCSGSIPCLLLHSWHK